MASWEREGTHNSRYPRAVSGGLSFDRVSAGDYHACAETTGNRAYCWGSGNSAGSLGDGTLNNHLAPVAVVGGLFFSQVSAGGAHSCGKTSEGRAYCWGAGGFGRLGNGSTANSSIRCRSPGRCDPVNRAGHVGPHTVGPSGPVFRATSSPRGRARWREVTLDLGLSSYPLGGTEPSFNPLRGEGLAARLVRAGGPMPPRSPAKLHGHGYGED